MEKVSGLTEDEIRQIKDAQKLLKEDKLNHLDDNQKALINKFNDLFDKDGNIKDEELNEILNDKENDHLGNFKDLINKDSKLKKLLGEDFFGRTKRNIGNSFKYLRKNTTSTSLLILGLFTVAIYVFIIKPIIQKHAAAVAAETAKCYYDCMPKNYKTWQKSEKSINKDSITPDYNIDKDGIEACKAADVPSGSSNSQKFIACKNFCNNKCCKNKGGDCETFIKKNECTAGIRKEGCPTNNPIVKIFNEFLSALGIDPGIASLIVKFILFIILTSFNIKIAPEFGRMFKPDGGGFFATAAGELLIIVGLSLLNF